MTTYNPETWVLLELSGGNTETIQKVFAGWYGGWAGSDSWKMSSAVRKTTRDDDLITFHNESGSEYICHISAQKMSGYQTGLLNSWIPKMEDLGFSVKIIDIV